MNLILFDGLSRRNLLPFTWTRPVGDLRAGMLTIAEKYQQLTDCQIGYLTEDYLADKFPRSSSKDSIFVDASIVPDYEWIMVLKNLEQEEGLTLDGELIAYRSAEVREVFELKTSLHQGNVMRIKHSWDLFATLGTTILQDFEIITAGRHSEPIPADCAAKFPERIFIEPGAKLFNASLNASDGPIYIGRNAEVMEGAAIRGPFALMAGSQIKMGSKIYGPTVIGPDCKIAGEVNNSLIYGRSNKAHEGFLGNSVLGEWCNLGADTNNSNLKNNYEEVKLWSEADGKFLPTGLQFCGLMMGDHSKCGINTMFNTGTVVGVSANIFGAGFPRNYVPSFSWGGAQGQTLYKLDKAMQTAEKVMARRKIELDTVEKAILTEVYNQNLKHHHQQ